MSERECKYYRCIKNKKEKYVQWWSFNELDFDEIMQEITLYIYLNRKDGLDFIILNGEERMFTEEIKGKKINTILMQIEEYYKKNDFKNISIYFKNWNVFLCKGQPDSYWRR